MSIDDRTKLLDLFAKILINSTRVLLKRGIDKNYIDITTEFAGIKGKLELSSTLKTQLHLKHKTICSFNEFSANILPNQLLASTLIRLLKTKGLDSGLKMEIKKLLPMFGDVTPVASLAAKMFSAVRFTRNNRFYRFVLHICRLIVENILPAEKPGEWQFIDFTRDERKMRTLFEKFIFNFYRLETGFKVRSEHIRWKFSGYSTGSEIFLPRMITDITLESPLDKTIIDAKFYRETLAEYRGGHKIRSANLYQLFSYLLNQRDPNDPRTETARGILLYPATAENMDTRLSIRTA